MNSAEGSSSTSDGSDVISLDDLDQMLADEDPEIADSLSDLKDDSETQDIEIESALADEAMSVDSEFGEGQGRWLSRFPRLAKLFQPLQKLIARIRSFFYRRWLVIRSRSVLLYRATLVWLRTRPKEYWNYSLIQAKALVALAKQGWVEFKALNWQKKLLILAVFSGCVFTGYLLNMNLKGRWIPHFNKPLLSSFADVASQVYTYDPKSEVSQFYEAFPQKEFTVLLPKIVINLRPSGRHRNPMGAFELFVSADSKDAAVEIKSREVELHDLTQRTLEGQTYEALSGSQGQMRLKAEVKKELNKALTSGWIRQVYVKTMILKP